MNATTLRPSRVTDDIKSTLRYEPPTGMDSDLGKGIDEESMGRPGMVLLRSARRAKLRIAAAAQSNLSKRAVVEAKPRLRG